MKLKKFVKKYVSHNSLVRLVYKKDIGHITVGATWMWISMDWEILQERGVYKDFCEYEVVGISSILSPSEYPDAINIVIKEK